MKSKFYKFQESLNLMNPPLSICLHKFGVRIGQRKIEESESNPTRMVEIRNRSQSEKNRTFTPQIPLLVPSVPKKWCLTNCFTNLVRLKPSRGVAPQNSPGLKSLKLAKNWLNSTVSDQKAPQYFLKFFPQNLCLLPIKTSIFNNNILAVIVTAN